MVNISVPKKTLLGDSCLIATEDKSNICVANSQYVSQRVFNHLRFLYNVNLYRPFYNPFLIFFVFCRCWWNLFSILQRTRASAVICNTTLLFGCTNIAIRNQQLKNLFFQFFLRDFCHLYWKRTDHEVYSFISFPKHTTVLQFTPFFCSFQIAVIGRWVLCELILVSMNFHSTWQP